MTKWIAPVIRLYLGQLTPEAVLAAADDLNENASPERVDLGDDQTVAQRELVKRGLTKKGQICQANFFSGELALQRGAKDEATRLFQLALTGCSKDFIEYGGANAELKALGENPPHTEQ
jgi:lipoprotein NlpI